MKYPDEQRKQEIDDILSSVISELHSQVLNCFSSTISNCNQASTREDFQDSFDKYFISKVEEYFLSRLLIQECFIGDIENKEYDTEIKGYIDVINVINNCDFDRETAVYDDLIANGQKSYVTKLTEKMRELTNGFNDDSYSSFLNNHFTQSNVSLNFSSVLNEFDDENFFYSNIIYLYKFLDSRYSRKLPTHYSSLIFLLVEQFKSTSNFFTKSQTILKTAGKNTKKTDIDALVDDYKNKMDNFHKLKNRISQDTHFKCEDKVVREYIICYVASNIFHRSFLNTLNHPYFISILKEIDIKKMIQIFKNDSNEPYALYHCSNMFYKLHLLELLLKFNINLENMEDLIYDYLKTINYSDYPINNAIAIGKYLETYLYFIYNFLTLCLETIPNTLVKLLTNLESITHSTDYVYFSYCLCNKLASMRTDSIFETNIQDELVPLSSKSEANLKSNILVWAYLLKFSSLI